MAEVDTGIEFAPFEPSMATAVLAINEACVPHVSRIDERELLHLHEQSCSFRVVRAGADTVGFCITIAEGAAYESPNYRWFQERHERFLYIDRIAISSSHHGRGLGRLLYDDVIDRLGAGVPVLTCEVNTRPPNPDSLAFHERVGFRIVGEQDTEGGTKRVALMARSLP